MKTRFNSFEEIDQRLKILQLQRSIRKEMLLFHSRKMTNALMPKNWLKTFDNVIYGAAFTWIVNRFLKRGKNIGTAAS